MHCHRLINCCCYIYDFLICDMISPFIYIYISYSSDLSSSSIRLISLQRMHINRVAIVKKILVIIRRARTRQSRPRILLLVYYCVSFDAKDFPGRDRQRESGAIAGFRSHRTPPACCCLSRSGSRRAGWMLPYRRC